MIKYKSSENVAFPLGGIGTGSISLASNGEITDFEPANRPARGHINPFTFFAIKAEQDGEVKDYRALIGDTAGSLMGNYGQGRRSGIYGIGYDRTAASGMKHFRETSFSAFFPFAEIEYKDESFPGDIKLTAFNPLIPLDSESSCIPAAFFEFTVRNTTEKETDCTIAFSCSNPLCGNRKNEYKEESRGILMSNDIDGENAKRGQLFICAADGDIGYQEYWYRSGWFDEFTTFIREFSAPGKLKNRSYDKSIPESVPDICTVTSTKKIAPGGEDSFRFIISWYYPYAERYWTDDKPVWQTYTGKRFGGAEEISNLCVSEYDRLYNESLIFKETFESQDLDPAIKEAIQANFALFKSTTCMRVADGTLYGWEGVTEKSGNCEGTCTHVWNYAYSLPYLFPDIERSIRESEFKYSVFENGKMVFRNMLPYGTDPYDFRACVDGQYGTVIKTYREWKISGDDGFIKKHYDGLKRITNYAFSEENPDRWDPQASGILTGRQHHTLDMELFGPSSWLMGLYLTALSAMTEIAGFMQDKESAEKYAAIYENGKKYLNSELYNGSYYNQKINLKDRSVIDSYEIGELIGGDGYYNDETGEIKYQIANGCEIDQVLGAWHADLNGLSNPFDPDKRKSALSELYKRNFKKMRDIDNPCRIFAADDESGLIMCSFDKDSRPSIPIPYAEECMTGFEYAAACNMIQADLYDEGLSVVRAIRERYTGERRNPFAEIECGASYARAMASYSLLPALSGFVANMPEGEISFRPKKYGRYFFAAGGAWGIADLRADSVTLEIKYGSLKIKSIRYAPVGGEEKVIKEKIPPEAVSGEIIKLGI